MAAIASVHPLVTVTEASASTGAPVASVHRAPTACLSAFTPAMGAYWLCPALRAATAASLTNSGPSKSGKPWARLTAPCSRASRDMVVKMVVPKGVRAAEGMGK